MFPGFPGEEIRRELRVGNEPVGAPGAGFVATRTNELYWSNVQQRGITNPQRASTWVEVGVGVYMYVSVTFPQPHVLKCKALGTERMCL